MNTNRGKIKTKSDENEKTLAQKSDLFLNFNPFLSV